MKPIFGMTLAVFAMFAYAAPPDLPTVDVNIVNGDPIPVTVGAPPATVVCFREAGTLGSGNPYVSGGGTIPQLGITCPSGVDAIDVQQVAFSPDIGSREVVKFRVTVGFSADTPFDPLGFLAILTDGAPQAPVVQNFVLDTTDPSVDIYTLRQAFSGLAPTPVTIRGTFYFIGTPVP
jgi:hypothetical protein